MTERPTAQSATDRIDTHEAVCAERYKRIDEKLDGLNRALDGLTKGAWGLLIAVCGWLALQVYDGLHGRDVRLPAEAHAGVVR